MPRLVVFSANAQRPSRTLALAAEIAARAAAHAPFETEIHDLSRPPADLLDGHRDPGGETGRLLAAIAAADALIVATPVYKGAYTGLFKHVFDLLPPTALAGKPIVLAATGGGHRHALVVEHHLRPLFGFFGALTVPTAIYASESEFLDARPADPALLNRIEAAARELAVVAGYARAELRAVA